MSEKTVEEDSAAQLEGGSYDVIRKRLLEQAAELGKRAEGLNELRIKTFGGSQLALLATERVRTANNCVPRDTRGAGQAAVRLHRVRRPEDGDGRLRRLQRAQLRAVGGELRRLRGADRRGRRVNPSGKLAETYPVKLADTPAYLNFPGENGVVRYGEGLFIGYRYYDSKEVPTQFPFGFGLSSTTIAYSKPQVSATRFRDVDGLTVSVDVTNTGSVAGKEVVQVYVHDQMARLVRPYKELKRFAKVELQPGETKTVSIPLNFRAFAYYDPAHSQWVTENGDFDILIGASAEDIRCTVSVTLESTLQLPSVLHRESTIRAWLEDPSGKVAFEPIYPWLTQKTSDGPPVRAGRRAGATYFQ